LFWLPTLFSGSGPIIPPPVLFAEKTDLEVVIFHLTQRSLLSRRPSWMDKLLNFLSGSLKLEQWAKKCIELRGECAE
jgi:hypothetical protein